MHCNCCDRQLPDKEIIWNEELGAWELCSTCLEIAMEAAYCDGFQTEDDEYIILDDEDSYEYYLVGRLTDEDGALLYD